MLPFTLHLDFFGFQRRSSTATADSLAARPKSLSVRPPVSWDHISTVTLFQPWHAKGTVSGWKGAAGEGQGSRKESGRE